MQKYQVFINDHLLSIVEKLESNQQFDSEFYLRHPDQAELKILINWLLSEPDSISVGLIVGQPKRYWEFFLQQFILIKAAGGIVVNDSNDILFIKRLGKWDLPKGKVESGENAKEAAIREVQEECGISQLKIKKELSPTYHFYLNRGNLILKQTDWFEMSYSGKEKLVPQKEEGIEEVLWVDPKNMQEQKSNTYASLKEKIESYS